MSDSNPFDTVDCPACDGEGYAQLEDFRMGLDGPVVSYHVETCPRCGGCGAIEGHQVRWPKLKGEE